MKKISLLLVALMLLSLVSCAGEQAEPTVVPTLQPTDAPTLAPTEAPTAAPTEAPTLAPTLAPTAAPTDALTSAPTEDFIVAPTEAPTEDFTAAPTEAPTSAPTAPTDAPTVAPTEAQTNAPTEKPTEAFALVFEKNGDTYCVAGYKGTAETVVIPATYEDLPVTAIKGEAFASFASLTSVELPASLKSIGDYAFKDCKKLESITLPADLLSVGSGAFTNCKALKSVTYGGSAEAWKEITVGNRNTVLTQATFIYLGLPSVHDKIEEPVIPEKPENPMNYQIYTIIKPKTMTLANGDTFNYRMYVPEDYDASKVYPVLIFLHGAGERGDDNALQMKNVVATLFADEDSPIHDAIFLCPQCPLDNQWVDTPWADGSYSIDEVPQSNESLAVLEMLASVRTEYSVDANRIYIMGLSMGGFGTWDLILRNPDLFAAAIPICGGGDPSKAEAIKNMPIRTFHGDADKSVPVAGTREMVEALLAVGGNIEYEELAGYTHNVWDYAANKEGLMDWLFIQQKGSVDIEVSFEELFGK